MSYIHITGFKSEFSHIKGLVRPSRTGDIDFFEKLPTVVLNPTRISRMLKIIGAKLN